MYCTPGDGPVAPIIAGDIFDYPLFIVVGEQKE